MEEQGEGEGGEGEDRERLLQERRLLKKQLRKAETTLWEKKEEDCKKGRKKLGSKLITSKEEYLRALVEKGIRRELRRTERIREYWARQGKEGRKEVEEEAAVTDTTAVQSTTEDSEELDTDENPEKEDKEVIQKEQSTEVATASLFTPTSVQAPASDPLATPSTATSTGPAPAPAPNTVAPPSLTLEACHLLEPAPACSSLLLLSSPSSPSLLLLAPPSEGEQVGLLVRLQDVHPLQEEQQQEREEQEVEVARRGSSLQLRGRLCLKRAERALYSCITCLVQCLGPV